MYGNKFWPEHTTQIKDKLWYFVIVENLTKHDASLTIGCQSAVRGKKYNKIAHIVNQLVCRFCLYFKFHLIECNHKDVLLLEDNKRLLKSVDHKSSSQLKLFCYGDAGLMPEECLLLTGLASINNHSITDPSLISINTLRNWSLLKSHSKQLLSTVMTFVWASSNEITMPFYLISMNLWWVHFNKKPRVRYTFIRAISHEPPLSIRPQPGLFTGFILNLFVCFKILFLYLFISLFTLLATGRPLHRSFKPCQ